MLSKKLIFKSTNKLIAEKHAVSFNGNALEIFLRYLEEYASHINSQEVIILVHWICSENCNSLAFQMQSIP